MRMSCNGCRVLRKGCSEDCALKPCLQVIKSPESQANATLFLAKFYGRAGLLNLINAGPTHLRPETFRSLLYEACGRIINPVHGAVGLMCSGDWPRCQAAVEAVLGGATLVHQPAAGDDDDMRHLSAASLRRAGPRKRGKTRGEPAGIAEILPPTEAKFTITGWAGDREILKRETSHDSVSVETVEPSLVNWDFGPGTRAGEIGLELSLGRNPAVQAYLSTVIEISDN